MADRTGETPKNWKDKLRRALHPNGEKENYVDPLEAARRQTENLGTRQSQTRETRQGTVEADQPIRGGRPEPLRQIDGIDNRIP